MKSEVDKSESAFRIKAENMMKNCAEYGFNRVFVQARPFCDAFYKSELFPASEYLSGVQGEYIGYDALENSVRIRSQIFFENRRLDKSLQGII